MKESRTEKKRSALPEILAVGLLFLVMAGLRIGYIQNHEIDGAGYYELCRIQIGSTMPSLGYGVGDLYARLLYLVFWLLGNQLFFGACVQLILQLGAFAAFYYAIRKLWGFIPAFAALAALLVFPGFRESLVVLNQENLLLLILALNLAAGAWLIGTTVRGRMVSAGCALLFLVAGICGGISVCLDLLYLAVPLLTVILLMAAKRPMDAPGMQKRRWQLPCYLLGLAAGFLACLFRQGKGLAISQQGTPGQWLQRLLTQYEAAWADYGENLQSAIPASQNIMNYALAILLFAVFAVAAVLLIIYSYYGKEPDMQEEKAIRIQDIETLEQPEQEEKQGTRYIENPLPVPKRHVKKDMDYAFEPDHSLMKYDVTVKEDDDFDLP